MPLPEKSYVYLSQLTRRWQTEMADLRDYAEQGQLEIQIWLDECVLKVYRFKKTEDGEIAPVPTGIINYKGYVILEPFKVRKIFREQKAMIHKFTSLDRKELLKLHPQNEGYPVSVDDLMVSRTERDRFETTNKITPVNGIAYSPSPDNKTGIDCLTTGRPSIMKRITEHYIARKASGETKPTLIAEAKYLRGWAQDLMPGAQIPTAETIRNNLPSRTA